MTRKGGRFVLGPKTKKDAFWSHAMLGLKVKQKVYILFSTIIVYLHVFVHVGSHLGRDKTIQKISSRFFWKNINEDIRIFVQHCDKCQRTNAKFSKSNAKLHPIVPMPNVWHLVGDFVCRYNII